jgi:glycine cleavage system transcriptional repressor
MPAMRKGLIITTVGRDRPGIVDRVTGLIFTAGGNVEDSRMAILGGDFALMVFVSGPDESLGAIRERMSGLAQELGLLHQVRETRRAQPGEPDGPPRYRPYRLSAVAMDHPGIVHQVAHLLAGHGVNVASLETRLTLAPTTGTPVFSLVLEAQVPLTLPIARLRAELAELASRNDLDLDLRAMV